MNFSVLNMLYEYNANPQEINVSRDQMTAEKIQQVLYHVGDKEKPAALLAVCKKHATEKGTIIVFVNYKERVPWVAALLTKNGIPAQGLSSLLRQEKRNKIIQGFKTGQFRALVGTDVASRGLDVVNYHLPEEAATYVHRIGRTARAGRDGIAVSICSSEDAYNQIRVEEFLGNKIPVEWLVEEDMPKEVKFPRREDEDHEDEIEEGGESSGPSRHGRDRGPRGRNERGGRDRGPRAERAPRAPREPGPEAPTGTSTRPIPRSEMPVAAAAEGMDDISTEASAPEARPERPEPRRERGEREGRHENREGRGPRREREGGEGRRGDRNDRGGRDRGRDRGRGRDRNREPREQGPLVSAAEMPNPLTGNPVIYDMKTGAPKNRSPEEFKRAVSQYNSRLRNNEEKFAGKKKAAPAIIKKISSKVTALFGNRK
jgi:ATP-dependent RNA helicase RhlB